MGLQVSESDDARFQYSEAIDVQIASIEQDVFALARRSSSFDVAIDARGSLGVDGATVRVYRSIAGIEFEVARRVLTGQGRDWSHFRGHVLSVHGVGSYRVTIQGGSGSTTADVAARMSYQSWGATGETPSAIPSFDPILEPEFIAGKTISLSAGVPDTYYQTLATHGEPTLIYYRQLWGFLRTGTNIYLQFWDDPNSGGSFNNLIHAVLLSAAGAGFSADFRDVHRGAVGNDGYRSTRALTTLYTPRLMVCLSSTPTTFTAPGSSASVEIFQEIRQAL